ncbi:MAG: glycosyl hydrolase-related protein [Spirochaetaceae bacterium]
MEKSFCVISHTHWDREWYLSFENFQIKLVQLIDNLLEILDEDPLYIFHLDAQTIVLEDYLEIKPYNKEKLYAHIKQGRILLGPWYVQNDFYLTSGESTIRNLLLGISQAKEAGKCTYTGYMPDQFGLISQLPQIFKGFGIEDCIFGRGYDFFEEETGNLDFIYRNSEFKWSGPDGSEILAIHIPHWYNNAQRFSGDPFKSLKLAEVIEKSFQDIATTPYLLLMNGVDHLEAQEDLLPILDEVNSNLPSQKMIKQIAMDEYLNNVRNFIVEDNIVLETYTGELRHGKDKRILQGTLSSRVYLKVLNSRAQNFMENILEPLYSMIWIAGAHKEYPMDFIRHLWKSLIKNHPHDSICGCSIDEVHEAMEDRYKRFFLQAEDLGNRAKQFLMTKINRENLANKDYLISIFNTVESFRSGIIKVDLIFPVEENVSNFEILNSENIVIPYSILDKGKKHMNMFTPINLPGTKEVDFYEVLMKVQDIPPAGFSTYIVKKTKKTKKTAGNITNNIENNQLPFEMENSYIKITINSDGKTDLVFKETGKIYKDIISLEDTEDCGDSYVYLKSKNSRTYSSMDLKPKIIERINNQFYSSFTLRYNLCLPEGYNHISHKRSEDFVLNRVDIKFSIDSEQPMLFIDFSIDNRSENHRLRALINTGIKTDFTSASTPFDIIRRDRRDVFNGIKNGTQPNSGFVCIDNEKEGIALFNKGLYEYEHLTENDGFIALTLLRANGKISIGALGEQWKVPGNQCLRTINTSMAIMPYQGNCTSSEITKIYKEYQTPLLSSFLPVDLKKFSGGRVAVQDSSIAEVFYREDKYPKIQLDREENFLNINGKKVVISAIKRAEVDNCLIVRLYNTSDEINRFSISYFKNISELKEVSLDEKEIGSIGFNNRESEQIQIMGKEIFTLAIR